MYVALKELLPMVEPNDVVFDGVCVCVSVCMGEVNLDMRGWSLIRGHLLAL